VTTMAFAWVISALGSAQPNWGVVVEVRITGGGRIRRSVDGIDIGVCLAMGLILEEEEEAADRVSSSTRLLSASCQRHKEAGEHGSIDGIDIAAFVARWD